MVPRVGFLSAGGWDERVSRIVGCDFATALRVAATPPLGVIRRPLVLIRKHPSNISADTEAMNLGDACLLEHVLHTRPELAPLADSIRSSIAQRRGQALDSAFSRRDFGAVRNIYRLLPARFWCAKWRAKRAVAGLPAPFNVLAATLLAAKRLQKCHEVDLQRRLDKPLAPKPGSRKRRRTGIKLRVGPRGASYRIDSRGTESLHDFLYTWDRTDGRKLLASFADHCSSPSPNDMATMPLRSVAPWYCHACSPPAILACTPSRRPLF